MDIFLTVLVIISIPFILWRRKKAGVTGFKSGLTSICLYLIALINVLAYWLDFLGIMSWMFTFALIFLAAYFSKYLPSPKENE